MNEYKDLGFAKLDMSRKARTGYGETVYCPGKTPEQLCAIFRAFDEAGESVLGTRCSPEQHRYLLDHFDKDVSYDPVSRILERRVRDPKRSNRRVAVCTGGTADIPVAEEAAKTLEFHGVSADRHYDVGIAGIHRLFARLDEIRKADVVIAVAGMEGALGGVLAGLVEVPVIAVPTSVGYGASFQGIAPLLTMLNSCAEGVCVVNIDNGFGAAVLACRMLRMTERNPVP